MDDNLPIPPEDYQKWKMLEERHGKKFVNREPLNELEEKKVPKKKKLTKKDIQEIRETFGDCYEKVIEILRYYVKMNEKYYHIVAVWILGTYLHETFTTFPYLYFNAMRGSGKSRLLKLIACLSKDGEILASMTEAVLFRSTGTLCIDEFEDPNSKEKASLRELLNVGYKKGAKIRRMKRVKGEKGEEQQIEEFEAYRPVVMANIWGMEEILGDRCISLILEKSNDRSVTMKIEDFDTNTDILGLKSVLNELQCRICSVVMQKYKTQTWNNYITNKYTTTHYTPLSNTTHNTYIYNNNNNNIIKEEEKEEDLEMFNKIAEIGIDGRNLELLFPSFIISKLLGEKVFEENMKVCSEIMKEKKEEEFTESRDVFLIDFISRRDHTMDYISLTTLTNAFKDFLGVEDEDDKWVKPTWVGRALKRLNLVAQKRRIARGIEVILDVKKAQEKIKIFKTEDPE